MDARVVGAFEAKTHLSALLDEVARGGEVLICRRGVPVARLTAAAGEGTVPVADTIAALRQLRAGMTLGGLDWRELRDTGRR